MVSLWDVSGFCCAICSLSCQGGFWSSFPFLSWFPFRSSASFTSQVPLGTWSPFGISPSSLVFCFFLFSDYFLTCFLFLSFPRHSPSFGLFLSRLERFRPSVSAVSFPLWLFLCLPFVFYTLFEVLSSFVGYSSSMPLPLLSLGALGSSVCASIGSQVSPRDGVARWDESIFFSLGPFGSSSGCFFRYFCCFFRGFHTSFCVRVSPSSFAFSPGFVSLSLSVVGSFPSIFSSFSLRSDFLGSPSWAFCFAPFESKDCFVPIVSPTFLVSFLFFLCFLPLPVKWCLPLRSSGTLLSLCSSGSSLLLPSGLPCLLFSGPSLGSLSCSLLFSGSLPMSLCPLALFGIFRGRFSPWFLR